MFLTTLNPGRLVCQTFTSASYKAIRRCPSFAARGMPRFYDVQNQVSRRSFLRAAALGSAGLAFNPGHLFAQNAQLPRKPNLIVFLPDQQRADTLAAYGAPKVFAPNLEKLASQSCVFQNAYVTQPVCTPSRSALLTGTWPHANGCLHNNVQLPHRFQCFPELLADDDYTCAYMGKWHLGDEVVAQHGFREWVSIVDGHVPSTIKKGRPRARSDYDNFLLTQNLEPDEEENRTFSRRFATTLPLGLSKPKFLETKVCDFLERHPRDPFVLFVAFFEPHPPYNGPLNEEHANDDLGLDATADHTFGRNAPLRYRLRQEWDQHRYGGSMAKHLATKRRYLGLVSEIDQTIGAVLSKLEQTGLAENTIVVHTSDHGDMMGAHRLFGKEVLFQEAVRVPWLVRRPGQTASVNISQPVSHIAFAPTLLDLLGKPATNQCAASSLAPLMRGETRAPENIFMQWHPDKKRKVLARTRLARSGTIRRAINESSRAVLSPDGWKLCLRDKDKNELYNLKQDPGERRNLYDSPECRDVVARLCGDIHRWQENIGDTLKV